MDTRSLPYLLVFGSQTTWPSKQYLNQLRAFLLLEPRLSTFLSAIRQLPTLWQTLLEFDPRLERVPGPSSLDALQRWIEKGESFSASEEPLNVLITPFTIIVHLIHYLHYLSSNDAKVTHATLLDSTQVGGIQGCCTGLLSAIAVACSKCEDDVVKHAATALRLAMCIGAYVDLEGAFASPPNRTTCLVVRWKWETGRGALLETLQSYREVSMPIETRACTTANNVIRHIYLLFQMQVL